MMFRNKNQKGFTLIELLVVIAIIGFIASLVIVALTNARIRSRNSKRVADIRQIISALELYYANCNSYPVSASTITLDSTYKLYSGTAANCGTNLGNNAANGGIGTTAGGTIYIGTMPAAPLPSDGTCPTAGPGGSDGNPYHYTGTSTTFSLTFCLGNQTGAITAGYHTANQGGIQ